MFPRKDNPKDEDVDSVDPSKPKTPMAALDNKAERMDADKDMLDVRNLRATIVNHLANGNVPTNSKDLAMLREVLNDIDRTAIASARLKVEQDANASAEATNRMLIQQFLNSNLTNVAKRAPGTETTGSAPEMPDDVQSREFVDGETHQGTIHDTIDSFQLRTGQQITFNPDAKGDDESKSE